MSFWYERRHLEIGLSLASNIPHFFSLPLVHVFFNTYTTYFAFFSISVLILLARGKYISAFITILFPVFYWALVMVSAPGGVNFYSENMLLPLSFMISLPVVAEIIPDLKPHFAIIFLLIVISRLYCIYQAHNIYAVHTDVYKPYEAYARKKGLNGLFIDEKLIDQKTAIVTWGSGYEMLLKTAVCAPDSCLLIQVDSNPERYAKYVDSTTLLVTPFRIWNKDRLPASYFKLPCGKYEIIRKPLSLH